MCDQYHGDPRQCVGVCVVWYVRVTSTMVTLVSVFVVYVVIGRVLTFASVEWS